MLLDIIVSYIGVLITARDYHRWHADRVPRSPILSLSRHAVVFPACLPFGFTNRSNVMLATHGVAPAGPSAEQVPTGSRLT